MWNPREHQEDEDDSWEVRAFAEDTNNIMGTTWPPRSYTCTFCRREFRSAQALGGHMNVHRRDRARLHHHHHHLPPPIPTTTSSFINIPPHHQDLVANGGLCLLYHLPNPNNSTSTNNAPLFSTPLNACAKSSPSTTLLNVSSYPPNSLDQRNVHIEEEIPQIKGRNKPFSQAMSTNYSNSFDFTMAQQVAASNNGFSSSFSSSSSSFYRSSSKVEEQEPSTSYANHGPYEELDLELRLGHRSTPT
ncbi:hypothetical protein RIF29_35438 [Crotalaria pallida]|uniref:C2H2-type domain-containing protein n=1 Tax=Crotalaria pallida TaxID=3830 RepID=A0AAN9EAA8_CROPI